MKSIFDNVIINFCPTGMVPQKTNTPHVPISPQEIIEQTHQAYEMGITISHLHAREDDGVPSYRKSIYQQIFEGLRKHCPELIICGSSSGRNYPEFEKRSEVIELRPDMCSLTLSSLNFLKQASVNAPDMIIQLAEKMNKCGVVPELECFDLGMINYGKYLIKKGILKGPHYWNFFFGKIAGFQANFSHQGAALQEIPKDYQISFSGLGEFHLPINSMANAMGYRVRVGLKENIRLDWKRQIKASNSDLYSRVHQLIEIHEAVLFKPSKFRKLGFYNRIDPTAMPIDFFSN